MKDYPFENGEIDLEKIRVDFVENDIFEKAHAELSIPCHDVFIKYGNGIFLIKRDNLPSKGGFFPVGGRVKKGVPTEESLKNKVKEECGLEIYDLKFLGCGRTIFQTDPFGHNKGTDTVNVAYFAKGKGEIKLDKLHDDSIIVTKELYEEIKEDLHPYVKDFLKIAIELI